MYEIAFLSVSDTLTGRMKRNLYTCPMPQPSNPPSTAAANLPYIFSLPKSLESLLTAHWIQLHPLVWSIRSPNQSIYPWSPFRFSHPAIPPLSNYITLLITRAGQLGPPHPPGMHLSCSVFSPCHTRNLLSPCDIHPVGNIHLSRLSSSLESYPTPPTPGTAPPSGSSAPETGDQSTCWAHVSRLQPPGEQSPRQAPLDPQGVTQHSEPSVYCVNVTPTAAPWADVASPWGSEMLRDL